MSHPRGHRRSNLARVLICAGPFIALITVVLGSHVWTIRGHWRNRNFYAIECCRGEFLINVGSNIPVSARAPQSAGWIATYPCAVSYYDSMAAGWCPNPWAEARADPAADTPSLTSSVPKFYARCVAVQSEADGPRSWLRVVVQLWPLTTLTAAVAAFGLRRALRDSVVKGAPYMIRHPLKSLATASGALCAVSMMLWIAANLFASFSSSSQWWSLSRDWNVDLNPRGLWVEGRVSATACTRLLADGTAPVRLLRAVGYISAELDGPPNSLGRVESDHDSTSLAHSWHTPLTATDIASLYRVANSGPSPSLPVRPPFVPTSGTIWVSVPWISLVLATAFLPTLVLIVPLMRNLARETARRKAYRCQRCGYDLRATPDRCPECGTVPSAGKTQLRPG
jgi:hypothetical protein